MRRTTVFFILLFLAFPRFAYALTVAPSIFDLSVLPGGESRGLLTITNSQNKAKGIRIEIADLTYTSNSLPQFTLPGNAPGSPVSWIAEEKTSHNVAANGVLTLPFRIRVPADAAPGGHYGAILVSEEADVTAGHITDIGVVSKLAVPIYLDVAGDVKREFEVSQFAAEKRFSGSLPITFSLSIKNTGTVHLQPHGVVTITHAWTNSWPAGTLIVNEDSSYILPKKERTFSLVWEEKGTHLFDPRSWGPYRADVELAAAGTARKTASTRFWIVPVKHMLIDASALILFLLLANRIVRRMKFRYGKRLGSVLLLLAGLAWIHGVAAQEVGVDVTVTQSPESVAAEQTLSTVTVEPFSHIPRGGRAAVMVQLKGDDGTFLASRTVTIRLFSGTTAIGTGQKTTNEQGLVAFMITSKAAQTARAEVYDASYSPPVKLIQEQTIIFDGESSPDLVDIVLTAGATTSVQRPWYTQIITFFVNLFRRRF